MNNWQLNKVPSVIAMPERRPLAHLMLERVVVVVLWGYPEYLRRRKYFYFEVFDVVPLGWVWPAWSHPINGWVWPAWSHPINHLASYHCYRQCQSHTCFVSHHVSHGCGLRTPWIKLQKSNQDARVMAPWPPRIDPTCCSKHMLLIILSNFFVAFRNGIYWFISWLLICRICLPDYSW